MAASLKNASVENPGFFHVRKGSNIVCEPKCQVLRTSNVRVYREQPEMGPISTFTYMAASP